MSDVADPDVRPELTVVAGRFGAGAREAAVLPPAAPGIPSDEPKIPAGLTPAERRDWNYLVGALHDYGLIHRTDRLTLHVIVKTYRQWLDAEDKLQKLAQEAGEAGYMITTPTGYQQPHQLYYVARDLKRALLTWLPEAALTIPSFAKMTTGDEVPKTPDMFVDPVEAFREKKRMISGASGSS